MRRRLWRLRELTMADRFGMGWRPELAAGIFSSLDRIEVVEVLADDYLGKSARQTRALKTLASQVPIVLHGVSMGLASSVPVERRRLDDMARLVDGLQPESWSEHFAFVRGGGLEIGHLAAPPRTHAVIEGGARNIAMARSAVGSAPLMENIATLIDPPGSRLDEPDWLSAMVHAADCDLLLDLHNVYVNCVNFGLDARDFLARIPADRIGAIHIAGGKWIEASEGSSGERQRRLLDDHRHEVPKEVYDLLTEVGARTEKDLTVILEHDADFPPMEHLLGQLDRARRALSEGRARQEKARVPRP